MLSRSHTHTHTRTHTHTLKHTRKTSPPRLASLHSHTPVLLISAPSILLASAPLLAADLDPNALCLSHPCVALGAAPLSCPCRASAVRLPRGCAQSPRTPTSRATSPSTTAPIAPTAMRSLCLNCDGRTRRGLRSPRQREWGRAPARLWPGTVHPWHLEDLGPRRQARTETGGHSLRSSGGGSGSKSRSRRPYGPLHCCRQCSAARGVARCLGKRRQRRQQQLSSACVAPLPPPRSPLPLPALLACQASKEEARTLAGAAAAC